MSEKKKILIFIDWFLPGYKAGGPIRSVANIVDSLHNNFEFHIITSDRDLGDKSSYDNIELNVSIRRENYTITYLTPENQKQKVFKKIVTDVNPDKIYFNSLFSYKFTLLPLFFLRRYAKPNSIILAPRGMLGKGALGLKKTKKTIFLKIGQIFKIYSGIIWHATTHDESNDIKIFFKKNVKIIIAENIPEKPVKYIEKEKKSVTKFVFISRISKKKNIFFALELFKHIKFNTNVIFDIYGPAEDDDYMRDCQSKSNELSDNVSVQFKNELSHNKVSNTLQDYHFFLFPTLHENYGHAIYEAFSASCPVIISNNTPWKDLEEKKIGWDISLDNKEKFSEVIQKCIDMKQEEYNEISKNAFNFAKQFAENSEAIQQTKKLFE